MKTKKTRRFPMFTQGEFPELDALKLQWDLMKELSPQMRVANLRFLADKLGFQIQATRS
jgi:hypothetical protein